MVNAQGYFSADPYNLIKNEHVNYLDGSEENSFIIRPLINNFQSKLVLRSELFYNNNYPNLENMGNRWIGKGFSTYNSLKILLSTTNLFINIEPYAFINQNLVVQNPNRNYPSLVNDPDVYNVLNDNRPFNNVPYFSYGLNDAQLFIKNKDIGFGISNSNMWWGPGIHNSLTMTNNTSGFPYLMIGTLNDKRHNNLSYNVRYIFSRLTKMTGDPYYTALVALVTYHNKPSLTMGFSRNFLSGGIHSDKSFNSWDALILPFEGLFIDNLPNDHDELGAHDFWDQTLSGFISLYYKNLGLKIYLELATDDHRQNWMDLRSQPDHNSAAIIGLRKYGLFNNTSFLFGFEYTNLKKSYTSKFRGGGDWWWKSFYDYSTYNGRRWASHSGSDSDDFYLYFGFINQKIVIIPGFNYERRGIMIGALPEVKIEYRLDLKYKINAYLINLYFERELIINSQFVSNKKLYGNVIWFGIEKEIHILN